MSHRPIPETMASYRPFPPPPHSTFGPPAPAPPPAGGAAAPPQYSQNWGYAGADGSSFDSRNYNPIRPGSGFPQHYRNQPPQFPYPPPDSSYPPPPAQTYYPSSQYAQFGQQPLPPMQPPPPPPPPSSPPPSSLIPPPPPPSQPPSPPPPPSSAPSSSRAKENRADDANRGVPPKHHKPPVPPVPHKKASGPHGRVETEEERRLRKKREFEKQRQEEKLRQQLKQTQNVAKAQVLSSGTKGHGSISGSRMGERKPTPLLSGDRAENRLKKPTTFICKLKFRNELPDLTAQPKLLPLRRDKDRFTKYSITSLEKMHKPQLYVEPDLGIPLDLLDLSVYNPPKGERLPLDPEDEELLRDDDPVTPVKKDGIKRKDRPTDKGMSWLVKTQYISPLNTEATKQSLAEKQARELREARNSLLEDFNNTERRIQDIEASFKACKSRPVHSTNSRLQPVEIFPLLPDFDRYDDQFAIATFDSAPTADAEAYRKLDKSIRDVHESRAVMKSYTTTGGDSAKPEKFLAYMAPSPEELSKDIYDENEDVSYTWVREYHWDVRGDDVDDPTTYLVAFDESEARYLPLPTKLILRKKRAREGKSSDEVEHFPAPARVTVRRRSTVASIELKESENYAATQRGNEDDIEEDMERNHNVVMQDQDDRSSGAEYDMSD